ANRIILLLLLGANPERLTRYLAGEHDGLRGRVAHDTNEPVSMQPAPDEDEREAAHIQRNSREYSETARRSERHTTRIGLIHPPKADDSIGHTDHACDCGKPAAEWFE